MSSIQYLGEVLSGFADVFEPLEDGLAAGQSLSSFLADFGWRLDPNSDVNAIGEAFASLPAIFDAIREAADALDASDSGGETGEIAGAVARLSVAVGQLVDAIHSLETTTPDNAWPAPLNSDLFWQTFPLEVVESLVFRYLATHHQKLFAVLQLVGFLSEDYSFPITAGRVPYVRQAIRWDRLVAAVTRPQDIPKDVYGWGGRLELNRLLQNLRAVAVAFELPAMLHEPSQALLNAYYDSAAPSRKDALELSAPIHTEISEAGPAMAVTMIELAVLPIPPPNRKDAAAVGLALYPRVTGEASAHFALTDSVSLDVTGGFNSEAPIRVEVRPDDVKIFVDPTLSGQIDADVTVDAKPPDPWIALGQAESSRLELRHAHASFRATGPVTDLEFIVEIAADEAALVIQFGEGDGFLAQILGTEPKIITVGLGLTLSSKRGLQLSGQAKLEVTIPIHQSIFGVIDFDSITITFGASTSPPGVALGVAVTAGLNIGPVQASVDRVGVQAALAPVPAGGPAGLLGDVDLKWSFLPPKGLGLAIDAGPVGGGGFVSFDPEAGRYAGILQLTLPILSITAIGLLDTKLPGGKDGFSFLIILTCNFPPIQLGYGFVLSGLGGLAGINRTVVVQALQDGVHSGSVDHILFPTDPVGHAAELISDLQTIFPPTDGQYVFGPMVELGWGAGEPLITAQLGLMLTLPNPIVIILLGKLQIALPTAEEPVVLLRIQIAGSLDITNKLLSIDATLRDSKLLVFAISGDVSLRLAFGSQPNFVFAMGGFNAHFQAPPNFPKLERMSIALSTGDNPRLALEMYMAVTANTFQIGARAAAYIEYGDFKISGDMGFDALFHFQPFSFEVGVEADVSVRGPVGFSASVHLDATLTGPDPIRCKGQVVIHFMGSHSVPIDIPFGQNAVEPPATPPDPWPALQAEIERTDNWCALLPGVTERTAVLTQSAGSGGLAYVDPMGGLTVRQRTVPLDRTIDKFGVANLASPLRFGITSVSVGTLSLGATGITPAMGPFAPAQFEKMSDAQKLSRPSFEPMNAGASIASNALSFGPVQGRTHMYETRVVDARTPAKRYAPSAVVQLAAHLGSPASAAPARKSGLGKYAPSPDEPPAAQLGRAQYVIADVSTLQNRTQILTAAHVPLPNPPEKGAMMRALESYYEERPADREKYAVMGAWELA